MRLKISTLAGLAGLLTAVLAPAVAEAQTMAIGPRVSFVRGDLATETPSTRMLGGTVRMRTSSLTTIEVSMDYRVTRNTDRTLRTRETPVQASLLVMPIRTLFTPYALGGVGLYSQKTDVLGVDDEVTDSSLTRKIGWHAGFGGELRLGRHAAMYVDYRYQFVNVGQNDDSSSNPLIPGIAGTTFKRQGSMWTSGVAFYF